MTPRRIFFLSFLTFLILVLLSSCADTEPTRVTILDSMNQEQLIQHTSNRSMHAVVKESNEVSFSVIYTGDLEEILLSSTSHFRALVATYELQLSAPFEIDEVMKGITLRTFEPLKNPLEIAKEISQCEEVLMVEAKNIPETHEPTI